MRPKSGLCAHFVANSSPFNYSLPFYSWGGGSERGGDGGEGGGGRRGRGGGIAGAQ